MIIARLHEISDYAFVIDIHKDCKDKIPEICSSLAYNSKDPVFLGYPYGLVEADQFARCQEYEKKFLQTRFLQSSRENFAQIRRFINTNNAHDVLDSIN